MPRLLDPARFGDLDLANRVIMAPMTRSRATVDGDAITGEAKLGAFGTAPFSGTRA